MAKEQLTEELRDKGNTDYQELATLILESVPITRRKLNTVMKEMKELGVIDYELASR